MFSLTVRDRTLIAHSLRDPFFGPAQRLHGATYVVEATLRADDVDEHGVVADLGVLASELRAVLAELDHRNLDEEPRFAGILTTTEVLARWVADQLASRLSAAVVDEVEVTMRESDVAWATYRRPIREAR